MKIRRLDPAGIQPPELTGIRELEASLPDEWFGYSNMMIRFSRREISYEIDVVFITHDRIFIVDLKDWGGRVESRDGIWYQNGEYREKSPARKVAMLGKKLHGLMERERPLGDTPAIENRVVFCRAGCDISGLSTEDVGNGSVKLADFVKELRDKTRYDAMYRRSQTWGRHRPLTEGDAKKALQRFFGDKEHFEPRQVLFEGYRPQDHPSFAHPRAVYAEYVCENVEEPSFIALLRYWDFNALPHETQVMGDRKEIASRERSVLNLIHRIDPDLYDRGVLRSKARDRDFNMRYWELFDLEQTMRRMREFLRKFDLKPQERIDIASKLLGRVAQLHRHQIAHRDLSRDSVWVDERRASIILSGFGCAHFPATQSLREMRQRLVAASTTLPEDEESFDVDPGTPYQQDVFLLGALVWLVLSSHPLPSTNGVVDFQATAFELADDMPPGLCDWFAKALSWEPSARWRDAIEMHDAYIALVRPEEYTSGCAASLGIFERDETPFFTYRVDERLKNDRATMYISGTGSERFIVKIWPVTSREEAGTVASLRRFFNAAADLKTARLESAQEIVDFGLFRNEAFLVSRLENGIPLSTFLAAPIDVDDAYDVATQLVERIQALHDRGISHGDLNPENALLENSDGSLKLRFIDMPEYQDPRFEETQTPAYSPTNGADGFERDRFAVCKLASQVLVCAGVRSDDGGTAAALLSTIQDCENLPDPWLTLSPLLSQIENNRKRDRAPSCVMMIGTSNVNEKHLLLPDDGQYYVTASPRDSTLSVVGADACLELLIDSATLKPKHARRRHADTTFLNWAFNNKAFTFEGEVYLYPSNVIKPVEVDWVLTRAEVGEALKRLRPVQQVPPSEIITVPQAAQIVTRKSTKPMGPLEVEALWRKTIEIEEEDVPEAVVTGAVIYDSTNELFIVPCDFSRPDVDFDVDARPVVYMNGRRIGDFDTSLMTSTELAVRNLKHNVVLSIGSRLTISSVQDWDNLARRKRAIDKILDDGSLIDGLVKYFAPGADVEPLDLEPAEITDASLERYRLNESQRDAFRKLWRYGPIGLLQGPPGTGKTSFIASFVHYAITEGLARNVLLLSQSHKAVDNAVERLLRSFGDDDVSLIRVGQVSKVTEHVARYHSSATQNQYRELFDAEMKDRVTSAAREMGLPLEYVQECFEYWTQLRAHQSILSEPAYANDEDPAVRGQYDAAVQFLAELSTIINVPKDATPVDILDSLLPKLAFKHDVTSPDLVHRLRQLLTLSREWSDALGGDRTLEAFLVKSRQVIAGTCVGVGHRALHVDEVPFDLVVIDEAAKCSPGDLAIGMQVAKRAILVGDHKQLPPYQEREHFRKLVTALGDPTALRTTDFERAFASSYGGKVGARLTHQYRMAPEIGKLVSDCFYAEDGLTTARGPSPTYYDDLPSPLNASLAWLDTADIGKAAQEMSRGTSFANAAEASAIIRLLKLLESRKAFWDRYAADHDDDEPPIGVICMYAAQSTYLKRELLTSSVSSMFQDRVRVDTVDAYQGRESPFIIVSLVRNNDISEIGHVGDLRRLNVALSRAMERLVVVGSSSFFRKEFPDNTVRPVLQYFDEVAPSQIVKSGSIQITESRVVRAAGL